MKSSTPGARWPRTDDLAFAPELAPLALLEAALAITVQALLAHNPALLSRCPHLRDAPRVAAALDLILRCGEMHDLLAAYRDGLLCEPDSTGTDDIPF